MTGHTYLAEVPGVVSRDWSTEQSSALGMELVKTYSGRGDNGYPAIEHGNRGGRAYSLDRTTRRIRMAVLVQAEGDDDARARAVDLVALVLERANLDDALRIDPAGVGVGVSEAGPIQLADE
ncbi:hypothetical protein GTY86_10940 [Streptomyces sp. SID5770]|uniref:hypothetical protein n=1 Tax=Streptomyces sp. SID5770 TaxID=2690308 RepID=UPI00136DCD06|nr:hypothetical protein [Streptomyces sp. SID5770]MZE51807.1 hypothetical protein [Streptomyces sp. SID5770]